MFSAVYPDFHRIYPQIIVEPLELSVRKQQELIARGDLDIGFQTLCEKQKNNNSYLPLLNEEIVLVIPKGHPLGTLAAPEGCLLYTSLFGKGQVIHHPHKLPEIPRPLILL